MGAVNNMGGQEKDGGKRMLRCRVAIFMHSHCCCALAGDCDAARTEAGCAFNHVSNFSFCTLKTSMATLVRRGTGATLAVANETILMLTSPSLVDG